MQVTTFWRRSLGLLAISKGSPLEASFVIDPPEERGCFVGIPKELLSGRWSGHPQRISTALRAPAR